MALRNLSDNDTIAAISTPLGEGGLGVIRISGQEAIPIADALFLPKSGRSIRTQRGFTAQFGHIFSEDGTRRKKIIDEALVLVMRAPRSYTCEDVVEISAHGGAALLKSILALVIEKGARLAENGEFTKRAFLNGRIDLLQAEAVLDLVQAKTELMREWASGQLEGRLSSKTGDFKKELLDILSHLEASIDFPDDFPSTDLPSRLAERLEAVRNGLRALLKDAPFAVMIKRGLKAVLAGRPNVGKSSLMNELARTNRVIVTPYPGTTRDVVEQEIQIRGIPLRLFDTAGIQDTSHPVEKEGIGRTKGAIQGADLVLYVLDASQSFSSEDEALISSVQNKAKILIVNKTDLPMRLDVSRVLDKFPGASLIHCSCIRENGLIELEGEIFKFINGGNVQVSDAPLVNSIRQKDVLTKALQHVEDAADACRRTESPELIAVDVRLALDQLGVLVGEVVTDEVLEALFSHFCIGK